MNSNRMIFILSFVLFLNSCVSPKKVQFETITTPKEKILRGIINRKILENDTSFNWFKENMRWGTIDDSAIQAFKTKKDDFTMIVFGGTWCPDTRNLLPLFYKLVDKSGYPDKKIELVAVDRAKTTINNLHVQYKITNVPTFIVLQNGKEVGRVVEYGTLGSIDKELGIIVSKLP